MDVRQVAAVVAGGGSGLGRATAQLLAERGAVVTVLDLTDPAFSSTEKNLRWQPTDITDVDQVRASLKVARGDFGQERILVNCAGIVRALPVVDPDGEPHDIEAFRQIISVNLIGTFLLCAEVAAGMAKNAAPLSGGERGVIINTSSVAAFEGRSGQSAYAASKAGVASLSLPMARDLAALGIRVVGIAPGLFRTPMFEKLSAAGQEALIDQVPFPRRAGDPGEFAELVLQIISNQMINGDTIRIDGGVRMTKDNPGMDNNSPKGGQKDETTFEKRIDGDPNDT